MAYHPLRPQPFSINESSGNRRVSNGDQISRVAGLALHKASNA
jgi:hypothetical protein